MDENRQESELELMLSLTKEFQGETDRAAAVLSAAYLDYLLGQLIAAVMTFEYDKVDKLLYQDGHGPLGAFSARIDTAYCLGLLNNDERSDFHIICIGQTEFEHFRQKMVAWNPSHMWEF
jgi:DNA-binding MltR family transcriptional regulator